MQFIVFSLSQLCFHLPWSSSRSIKSGFIELQLGHLLTYVNLPRTPTLCIPWFSLLQVDEIILNDKDEEREKTQGGHPAPCHSCFHPPASALVQAVASFSASLWGFSDSVNCSLLPLGSRKLGKTTSRLHPTNTCGPFTPLPHILPCWKHWKCFLCPFQEREAT